MAEPISNSNETFSNFFESWVSEQNNFLEELIKASNNDDEFLLVPLITRVVNHYEHYYKTKSEWAEHHVLSILSPSWKSSLEDSFLWIGGWRPSMAFHLLYSKSGLQLEGGLGKLLQGIELRNLGDLSANQLMLVDGLQGKTIKEEREISEKLAKHQESVADTTMVQLSHVVTELIRENDENGNGRIDDDMRVESELGKKEEGLLNILRRADELRLNTLKKLVNILSPFQAAHFLIAAAELHLRLHDWGKRRDATRHGQHDGK
ncbi:hypothetical protein M9H77_12318 [Catharanthus roseus]|uniref:Uncharacterized protein n=1 Tax=Catharanthus roseus TaxID=4058 RepID=A0ACC0BH31_CATRO|nr:hypothetical protein M9H77_12318 [Catharanthus roseus]